LEAALAKGGKLNEVNKKGETLVMACVDACAIECLKLLLSKGADLDAKSKAGDTAAIRAVKSGETQSLEVLIQHKPRCILACDDGGCSFVSFSFRPFLKFFVCKKGMSPLHWAVKLSDAAALDLLLECHECRDLLIKADKEGNVPIHVGIASSCSEDVLNRLLQAGKQQLELVEKKNGRTPLLVAVVR
jgi:ankyrin repeat protein